jgi:hypothetical protein
MLRRVVEQVLRAFEEGLHTVQRAATVELSPQCEQALGSGVRREALRAAFAATRSADAGAELIWHLFATGAAAELSSLPEEVTACVPRRLLALVAWGRFKTSPGSATFDALSRSVVADAEGLALAEILLGEVLVARGMRRRETATGLLDQAVPALHKITTADPGQDPEPLARAFGYFHKGRLLLELPPVLGQTRRGLESLTKALAIIEAPGTPIDTVAQARIGANARLALGRHYARTRDVVRARELLEAAASVDATGPMGIVANAEIRGLDLLAATP